MPGKLAALIRSKYPGKYDDMDDDTLEKSVLEKHPEYKDLVGQPEEEPKIDLSIPENPIEEEQPKPVKKEPSFLSKAYDFATKPLTDLPSRFAKSAADYIDNPQGEGGFWHGLAAGSIQGVGDVISSLSSPLNLSLVATGLGEASAIKAGLPELSKGLSYGTRALSAPFAAHGAFNLARPDSSLAERGMGAAELAGGILGMKSRVPELSSPIPENADWAVNELKALESGKYANSPELENIIRNSPYGEGSIVPSESLPTELRQPEAGNIQTGEPLRLKEDIIPPAHGRPDLIAPGDEEAFNAMFGISGRKSASDMSYDLARDKFNMGRDLPESIEEPKLEFNPEDISLEDTLKSSISERLKKLKDNETGAIGDLSELIKKQNIKKLERFYELNDKIKKESYTESELYEAASLYNDLKDVKFDEPVTISPYKNQKLAEEPPEFTTYILPDGKRVALSTSATKAAPTTTFQLKGGEIVTATKAPEGTPSFGSAVTKEGPPAKVISLSERLRKLRDDETGAVGDLSGKDAPKQAVNIKNEKMARFDELMKKIGNNEASKQEIQESEQLYREITRPQGDFNEMYESANKPKQASEFGEKTPKTELGGNGGNKPPNKPVKPIYSPEELDPEIPIQKRAVPHRENPTLLNEVVNATKGLMSVDLPGITSAAFRQAKPLTFTPDWFKAFVPAAKAFGSDLASKAIEAEHLKNPYFKPRYEPITNKLGDVIKYKEIPSIAEEIGVKTTDLLNNREEQIGNNLAEKIPLYGKYVKASNRAYKTFLNDLRVNQTTSIIDGAKAIGRDISRDSVLGKQISDYVNDSTGRGSLSAGILGARKVNQLAGRKILPEEISFERNAKALGEILWSPRNLASQLKFFNPATYTQTDPMLRMKYLSSLARIIGSWGAFTSLGALTGIGKVNLDPTNSDFGKYRIGNTRIDPSGGYQPLAVLMTRALTGKFTSSTTGKSKFLGQGFNAPTAASISEDFLKNRVSPVTRLAFDIINATSKTPVKLGDRSVQMVLPMYVSDITEAAKDDPYLAAIAGLAGGSGFGVQTYKKGEFGKSIYVPEKFDIKVKNPYPLRSLVK